ncbi:CAP domain-containing protein, partial [Pseudomonas syringae pv. tagetis]
MCSGILASAALASDETQLVESLNAYRGQAQRCGEQVSMELPPLTSDARLVLPASGNLDMQQALTRASYPMVTVQAISLSGPS